MASVYLHPLFFFLLQFVQTISSLSLSEIAEFPPSIHLPVNKDGLTGQYLTRVNPTGWSIEPTKLVLDLDGQFTWLDCATSRPNPVHCRSIQCSSVAKAQPCQPTTISPTAAPSPCSLLLQNPITGVSTIGELIEEALHLESPISTVDKFIFSCAPSALLTGLATGARGVLGLGRTRAAMPAQISHSFGYPQKFSLCLSASNGMIFSGQLQHQANLEISKSLIYTPLLTGDDYKINLKAIKIQNKKLSLGLGNEHPSLLKISTVSPFTKFESGIYRVFLKAFTMAAKASNMIRVSPVAPFDACYGAGSLADVPVIDLVLQSEMVKWRIYGHNSMVNVKDGVMCLGFLDGGLNLEALVVLGGHQLEDNLLEFDLGSSMLGFSSSLINTRQTSCSQLSSLHRDLQSL